MEMLQTICNLDSLVLTLDAVCTPHDGAMQVYILQM